MKRKLYELNVPFNAATIFYEKDGELININDPDRPEPTEKYSSWDPINKHVSSKDFLIKVFVPVFKVKKEDIKYYIKDQLPELKKWADKYQWKGNIFIVKKEAGENILIGTFVRNCFGGTLIDEI